MGGNSKTYSQQIVDVSVFFLQVNGNLTVLTHNTLREKNKSQESTVLANSELLNVVGKSSTHILPNSGLMVI